MKMEQTTLLFIAGLVAVLPGHYGKYVPKPGRYFYMPDSEGNLNLAILDNNEQLPRTDPENDITFFLWTRNNPSTAEMLHLRENDVLGASSFNVSRATKILSHGYSGAGDDSFNIEAKDAYLNKGDYNVIGVDWKKLAASPWYFNAASNTEVVGDHLAELIKFFIEQGASPESFHLIGFSLGSHVVGVAGGKVKPGRITGLDPAYPLFELASVDKRLDSSDADFVDIIHTCGGNILQGGLAFIAPIGDADFYPNGGYGQPGCRSQRGNVNDMLGGCSHSRAPSFFIESIKNQGGFSAWPCNTWERFQDNSCWDCQEMCTHMGDSVSLSARGSYYLATSKKSPYSLG